MGRIRQVRRTDGTLVPFRERKITESITRALTLAGTADRALAYELSAVVVLFLGRQFESETPTTAAVRSMVSRVLEETGHASAARKLEAERADRDRLTRTLTVTVDGDEGIAMARTEPWSRDRLLDHLVRRLGLPESVAEDVAAGVEAKLQACGFQRVTGRLLDELVRLEVEPMEAETGRAVPVPFSVPRERIAALARGEDPTDQTLDRRFASELWLRLSTQELFSPALMTAHREGVWHVHGLDDPLRVERARFSAALLLPEHPEDGLCDLLGLRLRYEALRAHVREEVRIDDLVETLGAWPLVADDPTGWADGVSRALEVRTSGGRRTGPTVHLGLSLDADQPGRPFREALLRRFERGGWAEALRLTLLAPADLARLDEELLELSAGLSRAGVSVALGLGPDGEPRGALPYPLVVSVGRVTVNLPLLVARTEAKALEDVTIAVTDLGSRLLRGFQELFWLQREGRPVGLFGLLHSLGGVGRVSATADGQEVDLEVWGLRSALDVLVDRGLVRPGRVPAAAAKLLEALDYAVSSPWDGVRLRPCLGATRDPSVRRRLFDACLAEATSAGNADLDRVLRARRADGLALPVGLPVLSETNRPLLAAPFAGRLNGSLAPNLAAFREAGVPLEATLRAIRERSALSGVSLTSEPAVDTLLEVQEELAFG